MCMNHKPFGVLVFFLLVSCSSQLLTNTELNLSPQATMSRDQCDIYSRFYLEAIKSKNLSVCDKIPEDYHRVCNKSFFRDNGTEPDIDISLSRKLCIFDAYYGQCETYSRYYLDAVESDNFSLCLQIPRNYSRSCDRRYFRQNATTPDFDPKVSRSECLVDVHCRNGQECHLLNGTYIAGRYEILTEIVLSCPGSHKSYGCGGIYYIVMDRDSNCIFLVDTTHTSDGGMRDLRPNYGGRVSLDNSTSPSYVVINEGNLTLVDELGFQPLYACEVLMLK